MKLSKLIQKNNEELKRFIKEIPVTSLDHIKEENIDYIHKLHQHSLLNNILEYIEGEKKEWGGYDEEIVEHNQALQLIEDYIKEALNKK